METSLKLLLLSEAGGLVFILHHNANLASGAFPMKILVCGLRIGCPKLFGRCCPWLQT